MALCFELYASIIIPSIKIRVLGFRGWPLGVIQSRIALLRLFVSSALALDAPFCIFEEE